MKKKINIGFDIGITSVGWAIVDEENNIIDRGVRLFEELKNPKDGTLKNVNRRSKRHGRRLISRRKNRKNDFIKLVTKKYFDIFRVESFDDFNKTKENFIAKIIGKETNKSVLDLILKGLNQELTPLELARVLYYYLSHRGYSYMTLEQWERKETIYNDFLKNKEILEFAEWYETNDSKDNKSLIDVRIKKINYKELNIKNDKSFLARVKEFNSKKEYLNKYPSEIQKMEFEKYGYFRGNEKINSEFSKIQWEKEIKKILENQKYLPNQFIIDYLGDKKENTGVFNRLRKFSSGPGSEKSPTKYGLYREKDGKVEKVASNLWDLLIGKCSVYPDLDRANKKSCSSEIANILNQLNTIAINDSNRGNSWLSEKEKKEIIFKMISSPSKNPLIIIKEICKLENTNNISKYPTKESKSNKSTDNQNLEKLDNTKILFSILGSKYSINSYDDLIDKKDFFNDLVDVFARFPKQYEAVEKELNLKIDDKNLVEELVLKSDKINSQSTSSMSYKALDLYIKEEIVDEGKTLNQKYKSKIDENEKSKFEFDMEKSKYINEDCLDDQEFVLSPTTKCSFRETLKVFNKILKRYIYNPSNHTKQTYYIKNVVMEMPTEWNSKDERDRLTKIKNANEERKNKAKKNYEYEGENKTIINKLNLLYSQNNRDVYTGKTLDAQLVINDPNYSEIDHIIPYSISYDDSWNNKVLVHRTSNQEKKNRTPREYLGKSFFTFKKMWEEMFLTEGEFYNKQKFDNLCLDVKPNDYRRHAGFIGRNLADTRYACRIGKQALNAWISEATVKKNLSNDEINIISVNGNYTQRYRSEKFLNLKKDREEDYSHHAIDATICAILGNSNDDIGKLIFFRDVDKETGEVKSTSKFLDLESDKKINKSDSDIPWKDLADNVKNFNVKFSYKIHKKSNFGFWGDTIISVKKERDDKGKEIFNQYKKVKLLEIDFSKVKKDEKNEFEKLIEFYENGKKYPDPKLWNDLMTAYNEGLKINESSIEYEKENPFKLYMQEYCKLNGIKDFKKMKSVFLEREVNGKVFKYSVSAIKKFEKINSFAPVKNTLESDNIGAYSGLDWKEIRLFKNNKGVYKVIPMRINLYDNYLKEKVNQEKYNEIKKEFEINLDKDNYFVIHKGTLMINKNNKKDIRRIVGGHFNDHKLELKEIYKESEQRNQLAITTIMKNYDFCTIDELGNVSVIKEEELGL